LQSDVEGTIHYIIYWLNGHAAVRLVINIACDGQGTPFPDAKGGRQDRGGQAQVNIFWGKGTLGNALTITAAASGALISPQKGPEAKFGKEPFSVDVEWPGAHYSHTSP
jgi:hypothetical protein